MTSRLLQISSFLFPTEIYKLKYFTSKLSCFVVPQVGCSSLPVGPAAGTLGPSTATCGGSAGEIKVGCDSVVGGDEMLQVVGTPVSNSSESLPSVLVPTTAGNRKELIMQGHYSQNLFDLRNCIFDFCFSFLSFLCKNRNCFFGRPCDKIIPSLITLIFIYIVVDKVLN